MGKRPYGDDIATVPIDSPYAVEAPRLVLNVIAHGSLTTHQLPRVGQLTIGRGANVDISIDDPSSSRRHAVLHVGPELSIEDAGSANGTRVSGQRLANCERRRISIGETIEIGSATLVVLATTSSPATRPRRLGARSNAGIAGEARLRVVGPGGRRREVSSHCVRA